MITAETIQAMEKDKVASLAPSLTGADIAQLVDWLAQTDNSFRYKCFLLLQARSQLAADVYPHWDVFAAKLNNENSYQRSLGLMLIAENTRWDQAGRFEAMVDRYLSLCDDEKPVTVRQCVQSLCTIVATQPNCLGRITDKLLSIDVAQRQESQRKILLMDILAVLAEIQQRRPDHRIMQYFYQAMTGEILDRQAKRAVAAML
jgi:hypothetical protein